MAEIPVHIYFVLDRSGSMASIASDVIGGFNAFIADQKTAEGECRLTAIQFDSHDPAEILYDAIAIEQVQPLTPERFVPRGMTPLLDAEGWMIARARTRELERAKEGEGDEAVLFVTFTDGLENSSREWTYERLTIAKKDAEERGWAFTYLGCGHDGYRQSMRIGTSLFATRSFDATHVVASMQEMSSSSLRYRRNAMRGRKGTSKDFYATDDDKA